MRNYVPNIIESAQGANTHFNIIRELLLSKKYRDGLSNQEISIITKIPPRRVREVTQRLKMQYA